MKTKTKETASKKMRGRMRERSKDPMPTSSFSVARQAFDAGPGKARVLAEALVPLDGVTAYLSQSDTHQIVFMEFARDVDLPEHAHADQVGIVLEGKIELVIDGEKHCFTKGDRYYIPEGVTHSGKVCAGYADITSFNEPHRYGEKGI
jgi:quercetin dioxygenase-like cupin family protein